MENLRGVSSKFIKKLIERSLVKREVAMPMELGSLGLKFIVLKYRQRQSVKKPPNDLNFLNQKVNINELNYN